jgi:flagellar assembly factor FliW
LGEILVEEENIITLKQGLIGFPTLHKYAILEYDESLPFKWLQSLDNHHLSFVIINPLIFKPDYTVKLSHEEVADLHISNPALVTVYTIVTIPTNPEGMTANLLAPILINTENRLAKQVILVNSEYSTRHRILDELYEKREAIPSKKSEVIALYPSFGSLLYPPSIFNLT